MAEEVKKESGIKFSQKFKKFEEGKAYEELPEETIEFDSASVELDNVTDIYVIMDETNKIPAKLFKYGYFCDSQKRVIQQLEDKFERWKAERYHENGIDDKAYKTEKSKERFLMVRFPEVYDKLQADIAAEYYKLALLQRVVKSLESYSYKLHDLKEYNFAIERHT